MLEHCTLDDVQLVGFEAWSVLRRNGLAYVDQLDLVVNLRQRFDSKVDVLRIIVTPPESGYF